MSEPATPNLPASPSNADPLVPIALPDSIPQHWLCQIRDTVKTDHTSAVLTILVAIIAAGASILAAYLTNKASGDLEIKKARLASCQANNKTSIDSYVSLEKNLNQLRQQFEGAVTWVEIARSNHVLRKSDDTANFRSQVANLGEKLGTVIALKNDADVDPTISDDIDKAINDVAAAIRDKDPDLAGFSEAAGHTQADLIAAIDAIRKAKDKVAKDVNCDTRP